MLKKVFALLICVVVALSQAGHGKSYLTIFNLLDHYRFCHLFIQDLCIFFKYFTKIKKKLMAKLVNKRFSTNFFAYFRY